MTQVWNISHWPFYAWAFIAMMIGQVFKSAVWTKTKAHTKGRWQWLFWWGYKTLPLHPIAAGCLLGLVWQNPEQSDPAWPLAASVTYFAAAGALSVTLYQILKGLAKRHGLEFDPVRESGPPPELAPLAAAEIERSELDGDGTPTVF